MTKYVSVQFQGMTHLTPFSEVVSKFNYLFITREGASIPLIEKIRAEDNNIKVHFTDRTKSKPMQGLVGNWESWKNWADVIVYDDLTLEERCSNLTKNGYLCTDYNSIKEKKFDGKISLELYRYLEESLDDKKKR